MRNWILPRICCFKSIFKRIELIHRLYEDVCGSLSRSLHLCKRMACSVYDKYETLSSAHTTRVDGHKIRAFYAHLLLWFCIHYAWLRAQHLSCISSYRIYRNWSSNFHPRLCVHCCCLLALSLLHPHFAFSFALSERLLKAVFLLFPMLLWTFWLLQGVVIDQCFVDCLFCWNSTLPRLRWKWQLSWIGFLIMFFVIPFNAFSFVLLFSSDLVLFLSYEHRPKRFVVFVVCSFGSCSCCYCCCFRV